MKLKLDYILLGVLWLLAVTLGACFWFNTWYGFNIFSSAHWGYLAQMQASRTAIRPGFYISMAVALAIAIGGMYMLMRPRLRKINLPRVRAKRRMLRRARRAARKNKQNSATPAQAAPSQPTAQPATQASARPPRPVSPIAQNTGMLRTPTAPVIQSGATPAAPLATAAPAATDAQIKEIRDIFERAGYVIKPTPTNIKTLHPALFAIGANETLWLGAVGATAAQMHTAIDTLSGVFNSVLDDIDININSFVIGAPDAATAKFPDVLIFDSISALAQYMSAHPNPPISGDEADNFDAYSAFITTVAEYIGKI